MQLVSSEGDHPLSIAHQIGILQMFTQLNSRHVT